MTTTDELPRSNSISSLMESVNKIKDDLSLKNLNMSLKHFVEKTTNSFRNFLKIGCFLRFLPYQWNKHTNSLHLASGRNMTLFKFQKNLHLYYTSFMWIRFLHRLFLREFSLVAALWCLAFSAACLSYITMSFYTDELMQFTNRLLNKKLLGQPEVDYKVNCKVKIVDRKIAKIETENQKCLNYHLSFNMFLVYFNPVLHMFTVAENPCAPNFISSVYFNCAHSMENTASLMDKTFFLVFEYYNIAKWQYAVSFMWCCLYMGTGVVRMELQKLAEIRKRLFEIGNADDIQRQMKICELIIHFLNHTLRYYMGMFVMIGCTIVALLLYGTIKYWRLGFQAIIMFPLCAIRCGFEVLTPLSIAGTMSKESEKVMQNWKAELSQRHFIPGRREKMKRKYLQKSCKILKCKSGMFARFDKLVLLATVDICATMTVNLLVFDVT